MLLQKIAILYEV